MRPRKVRSSISSNQLCKTTETSTEAETACLCQREIALVGEGRVDQLGCVALVLPRVLKAGLSHAHAHSPLLHRACEAAALSGQQLYSVAIYVLQQASRQAYSPLNKMRQLDPIYNVEAWPTGR